MLTSYSLLLSPSHRSMMLLVIASNYLTFHIIFIFIPLYLVPPLLSLFCSFLCSFALFYLYLPIFRYNICVECFQRCWIYKCIGVNRINTRCICTNNWTDVFSYGWYIIIMSNDYLEPMIFHRLSFRFIPHLKHNYIGTMYV